MYIMTHYLPSQFQETFRQLRRGVLRKGYMNGPFGTKPIVYADATASGIVYEPISEYIRNDVFPFYSNTHSNAICGKYMSELIENSKKIIRQHYNCDDEGDQIIFTGNGCTGAILHLIHAMDLKRKMSGENDNDNDNDNDENREKKKDYYNNHFLAQFGAAKNKETRAVDGSKALHQDRPKKIVVFVSITEHHSNYLPWRHLDVVMELVPITNTGHLDAGFMIGKMGDYRKRHFQIIASFSGASNVSGIIEDWSKISIIVHSFDGVMLWDMAACGPYLSINMHKNDSVGDYMDAIFVSPHKFLGGPGCPGLLIAHKKLFVNKVPYCPGGGTVRFVCKKYQVYNPDIEIKETGGTPNILGCVQLGKVYELKKNIQPYIDQKENILYLYCYVMLKNMPNLILIRPESTNAVHSLPIFSFIIRNFHCNLVVVLLNDLFGIQSRGGVSCCSVFAQNILHLDQKEQDRIYASISNGQGVPENYGWCRVSFHFLMTREEVNYILEAIFLVSKHIAQLSQFYEYDASKNSWSYKSSLWKNIKPSQKLFVGSKYTVHNLKDIMQSTKQYLSSLDIERLKK